jgi:hypothetical protein
MVGARIGGTRDDEDYADLSAWGGTYGQGNADVHCIWSVKKTVSWFCNADVCHRQQGGQEESFETDGSPIGSWPPTAAN